MLAQYTEAHTLSVNSLVFSPHRPASASPLLCSTSSDATTAFWDTRLPATEACVLRLTGLHSGPINHALFLPSDEHTLLTAADDASIICWDIRRPNALVARLDNFHEGVNKMILLPPDSITDIDESVGARHVIASACDDGLVYIHAIDLHASSSSTTTNSACQTKLLDKFWVSTSTVNDLLVLPHAPHVLITASEDCALRSWRLKTHTNTTTTTTTTSNVGGGFGVIRTSEGERLIASLDEFENPVNHVALVPAGLLPSETSHTRPAAATPSHNTGNHGTGLLQHEAVVEQQDDEDEDNNSDAATPSSTTRTRRNSIHRNNEDEEANNNEEDNEDDDDEGNVWLLAACSEFVFGVDMRARRGRFGRGARSFVGHRDYVRGLEFSSAGTLLTVSDDGTAMEWDIASSEPIRQVRLHDSYVMASAVAPQKEMLASGSDDGVIRLWRLPFETERMTGERA